MMWEVIVGNIGSVYLGRDVDQARKTFREYVRISKEDIGLTGHEEVTLMCDNEIIEEYNP